MRSLVAVAASIVVTTALVRAQTSDPLVALTTAMASAEEALRGGEPQIAESRYRDVLQLGWTLTGLLRSAARDWPGARDAFARAAKATVSPSPALQALATAYLQEGKPREAIDTLTPLALARPGDADIRRRLAQALVLNGQPEQAVQELEEAHGANPADAELTFQLASGYLRLGRIERAAALFAELARARPQAETHVLIGRAYRDASQFDRARTSLEQALTLNPRVRHAHYYLGTAAVMSEGVAALDEAIRQFTAELQVAPGDPVATLRLGMALTEAQRPADALSALEAVTRSPTAPADAFQYLGRCQNALKRWPDAIASLNEALARSKGPGADPSRLRSIHYQLGVALREAGRPDDAERAFGEAERLAAERAETARDRLARYVSDAPDPRATIDPALLQESSPVAGLSDRAQADLSRAVTTALARAAFNLGVLHAQAQRFARAAEFLETTSELAPDFPRLSYTLGVTYFNLAQYAKAVAPLQRALTESPADGTVRRMLALSELEAERYAEAAALLEADPQREQDASLQYAYGVALVRSDRAADAERIFGELLAKHQDSAEVTLVLGMAQAQQGDLDAAATSLERALTLQPDIAEAHATLGLIHLKHGRLPEAETELRAELAKHPANIRATQTLATVLDLRGQRDEAVVVLRRVLATRPDFANARYLLGKILLSQGHGADAVAELEAAAKIAPEDANVRYQLGQAYQKTGHPDLAAEQFEAFRRIKDQRRGGP
jgi:tetratricopeptide (TPR) repeat protein